MELLSGASQIENLNLNREIVHQVILIIKLICNQRKILTLMKNLQNLLSN